MRASRAFLIGILSAVLLPVSFSALSAQGLTPQEKEQGWELLFDGADTARWREFGGTSFPQGYWVVSEGCLKLLPTQRTGWQQFLRKIHPSLGRLKRHHLITREQFVDFDLKFEWKIQAGTNNGVKYFITEKRRRGHEYQILDEGHPRFDRLGPKYRLAALYDLKAPSGVQPRPVGEFNSSRIRVEGNRVETWLNGTRTMEYELESRELKQAVAASKFSDVPDFDKKIAGHIMLTDHGDEICFRNIRIRRLGQTGTPTR